MVIGNDPVTFAQAWERAVEVRFDQIFLIFQSPDGNATQWTYSDFDALVARTAGLLVEKGVHSGDSVHMALANCPAFVATWLASIRLGAWVVPSDPMAAVDELAGHIARTNPTVGICATTRADVYRSACGSVPVVEIDESESNPEVLDADPVEDWPSPDPTDRAAVMFTSGTTGTPKGVEITQANYVFAGRTMAEAAGLQPADRHLVVLPLFHANAQYYSFAPAIWLGGSVALMPHFSASNFLAQAAEYEATVASLFAAPIRMILARGKPVENLQLRHCWFAQNITADQYATATEWFGCRPRQLYGMTETIPAVLTDEASQPEPSSMGRVTDGCVVDVQRPDGTTVEPGEVGEVVVRGDPGITLFAGYLDDPETTANSFREGWFLTGDRATRDETGRHFFDGRRSDVLKVAGENVSTVEVEAVLAQHPAVLEAAVVGRPDEIRDEVPVAFVVLDPEGPASSVKDIHSWCEQRLAKAKRPGDIHFLEALPRTSVGKVRKFKLNDWEGIR